MTIGKQAVRAISKRVVPMFYSLFSSFFSSLPSGRAGGKVLDIAAG
jgi:hypothetical protein